MSDHWDQPCCLADLDVLGHRVHDAYVLVADVARGVRSPIPGRLNNTDHLIGLGVEGRGVVQTQRNAPGPVRHTTGGQATHPDSLRLRGPAIIATDNVAPNTVERCISANVDAQTTLLDREPLLYGQCPPTNAIQQL